MNANALSKKKVPFMSMFKQQQKDKSQTQEAMFYVTVNQDGTYSVFNKYIDGAIPVGKINNEFYVKYK